MEKLFLSGCANRASICASAAGDALSSVDYILVIALGDAAYGTTLCASAAGNALIRNLESHCEYLRIKINYILPHIFKKSSSF